MSAATVRLNLPFAFDHAIIRITTQGESARKMFDKRMTRMDPFARGLIKILSNHVRSKDHVNEPQELQELAPPDETG